MSVAKVATNEGLSSSAPVRFYGLLVSLRVERLMHHVAIDVESIDHISKYDRPSMDIPWRKSLLLQTGDLFGQLL